MPDLVSVVYAVLLLALFLTGRHHFRKWEKERYGRGGQ